MEKDTPNPKTQPSGNRPPPRPPTLIAIGMVPDDEDPRNKRRQEIVRMDLAPKPTNTVRVIRHSTRPRITNLQARWPNVVLLIFAIWSFIAATGSVVLFLAYSENFDWNSMKSVVFVLLLFFLCVIFIYSIRHSKIQTGNPS